jgi:hypothetical protein
MFETYQQTLPIWILTMIYFQVAIFCMLSFRIFLKNLYSSKLRHSIVWFQNHVLYHIKERLDFMNFIKGDLKIILMQPFFDGFCVVLFECFF